MRAATLPSPQSFLSEAGEAVLGLLAVLVKFELHHQPLQSQRGELSGPKLAREKTRSEAAANTHDPELIHFPRHTTTSLAPVVGAQSLYERSRKLTWKVIPHVLTNPPPMQMEMVEEFVEILKTVSERKYLMRLHGRNGAGSRLWLVRRVPVPWVLSRNYREEARALERNPLVCEPEPLILFTTCPTRPGCPRVRGLLKARGSL